MAFGLRPTCEMRCEATRISVLGLHILSDWWKTGFFYSIDIEIVYFLSRLSREQQVAERWIERQCKISSSEILITLSKYRKEVLFVFCELRKTTNFLTFSYQLQWTGAGRFNYRKKTKSTKVAVFGRSPETDEASYRAMENVCSISDLEIFW